MLWLAVLTGVVALAGVVFALRSDSAASRRVGVAVLACVPLLAWLVLRAAPPPEPAPSEPVVPVAVEPEPAPAPAPRAPLPPAPAPKPKPKPVVVVEPLTLEELTPEKLDEVRDRHALMGSANVIRHYEGQMRDWHMVGLKISNVRPDSYWALAGVRSGDIILEWDRKPVTGAEMAILVIKEFGNKEKLHMVVRGEDEEEREIRFEVPRHALRD